MSKVCENCGAENNDKSTFCSTCGNQLHINNDINKKKKEKTIIIALIAVIAIMLIGLGVYASGILSPPEVPLENHDFGILEMSIPKGSHFEEFTSIPEFGNIGGLIYLENTGNYSSEVTVFGVSKMGASIPSQVKYDRQEGDVKIFKDKDEEGLYLAAITKGDYFIDLMGRDPDTMVKMLNSVEIKDNDDSSSSQQTTSAQSSSSQESSASPTTTSMSILGGSFSTGSSLSDKTYASIYVGPEHSGENVKIQIWYSRDGATLNNGNMVPKTVDSSGYINVRSADAYSKYPDYAEVNVYDTSGNLLDSVSVTLSPDSGTQSF